MVSFGVNDERIEAPTMSGPRKASALVACLCFQSLGVQASGAGKVSINHGTFITYQLLSEFAVVGADSISLDDNDRPFNYCKVIPLSDRMIFFSSGLGAAEDKPGHKVFDINQSAKHAFVQGGLTNDPAIVGDIFAKQTLSELTEITRQTGRTMETGNNGLVYQASFVGGAQTLSETNIIARWKTNRYNMEINRYEPPQNSNMGYQDILRTHMSAADAKAIETIGDRLKTTANLTTFEDDTAAIIERVVRIVITYSGNKLIGGEPIVAILDRTKGFRWFRQLDFCPEK